MGKSSHMCLGDVQWNPKWMRAEAETNQLFVWATDPKL